jgi:hypothetical protein
MGARAAAGLVVVALAVAACAAPWEPVDTAGSYNAEQSAYTPETVAQFDRHALYWLGERFEGWNLSFISDFGGFITFVYGDCEPDGGDEPGCTPPLSVQVFPPCFELRANARNPRWQHRRWRGAPVGAIDSAPLLFGRGAQVKVYAVVPDDPGLARRAMEALRSANAIAPVVGPGEPIPGLPFDVLAGGESCRGSA